MDKGWAGIGDLELEDIQRELVFQLGVYEPRAGRAYTGALHLLYGKRHPGWASLLAYGLRDVIDILADAKIREMEEEKKKEGKDGKKKKETKISRLAWTLDRTTHSKYDLGQEYQALTSIRGMLKDIGHRSSRAQEEMLISKMTEMEGILHRLTMRQTKTNKEVDEIMSMPSTPDRARELVGMIRSGATQYRIISRLPPSWVDCMAEAGFFGDPKKYWAAHRYLYRCTKYPESVARIITSYDAKTVGEKNELYIDILEIARQLAMLPGKYRAAGHVEAIARYLLDGGLSSKFEIDPGRYFDIIYRIYASGGHETATGLLYGALSSPDGRNVWSRHGSMLDRIGRIVREVKGDDLLPLLRTMADLLDMYIDANEDGVSREEASSMSKERLYIADSDENMPDNVKTAMVTHVRDCLYAVGKGSADLHKAMGEISGRKHLVWRRMEMHIYCKFLGFEREMEGHATKYVWQDDVRHEYMELLGRAGSMSDETRRRIQEEIMSGPGREEMDRLYEERGGEVLDRLRAERGEEETDRLRAELERRISTMLDLRRLRRLEAASEWIDEERLDAYIRLSKRYGEERKEEEKVFAGKSTEAVLGIMGSPDSGHTYKTLSEFEEIVRGDPSGASSMAMRIKGADAAVQAKLFAGLEKALRHGVRVDWEGVMPLVQRLVSRLGENDYRVREAVIAACHMLRAVMRGKKDPGPRKQAWKAASELARMRPIYTDRGTEDSMFTRSLNNIEGLSFHIMVLYALWDAGDGLSKRAAELLGKYARDPRVHEASRNAVMGAYMPSLSRIDTGWALGMAESMLSGPAGEAFWNGYVMMNPLYADFFPALARWYDGFLNGAANQRGSRMHMATFSHVLAAYLHGREADDVFEQFRESIKVEESELVDRCVSAVDLAMKSWDDPDIDWDKIGRLWTHPAFIRRDLSVWFIGSRQRGVIKWYARHVNGRSDMDAEFVMTDILVDELGKYASEFPPEVAGILLHMVGRPADKRVPPGIHAVLDELEEAGGEAAKKARTAREMAATLGCGRPA